MSDAREPDEPDPSAAALRALYRRLAPPPLPDALSHADPETARVVGWMQDAWRGVVAPPVRLPGGLTRVRPRVQARIARRALVAAAAGLLLLTGAALLRSILTRPAPPSEHVAQGPLADRAVEILAVLPDRLELRSGPVRLVLLDPPTTSEDLSTRPNR